MWHDLLEAQQCGLTAQLPAADLAAAFLRVLLLAQQYHLAVQLLPMYAQAGAAAAAAAAAGSRGGTPKAASMGEAGAEPGSAFDQALAEGGFVAAARQQAAAYDLIVGRAAAEAAAAAEAEARPASAEAALAALTGRPGGAGGGSRFGVRRALHNAAGVAVSSSARIMGVSAHLVNSTAHLVGSTAQAVQSGTGGVVGATAGLVSGTASLVSSAASFAADTASKAGSKAGGGVTGPARSTAGSSVLHGAAGLLDAASAEAVVVGVSKELLSSASSLEDAAVAAAEAVLCLLPSDCKVRRHTAHGSRRQSQHACAALTDNDQHPSMLNLPPLHHPRRLRPSSATPWQCCAGCQSLECHCCRRS